VRHPSPISALTLLVMFTEKKMTLTEKQFDFYQDEVIDALERANNERYRLTRRSDDEQTTIIPEE